MATFTALTLWALTVGAAAANNVFPLAGDIDLSGHQDPSKVVNSNSTVYLLRVSGPSSKDKPFLCVRSRYLGREDNVTKRTLDTYIGNKRSAELQQVKIENNGTKTSKTQDTQARSLKNGTGSVNISLSSHKMSSATVLDVNVTTTLEKFAQVGLPVLDPNTPETFGVFQFLVLYGDYRCLLLAGPLNSERKNYGSQFRPFSCSLWLTEDRIKRPPACCNFLFYILCGEGATVFQETCLPSVAPGNKKKQ
uniref:Lipocalin n=1 Tax=Rhipicephalus appendiculatus TaxID=34631 RepID=A0A131Z1R2_RHIAP